MIQAPSSARYVGGFARNEHGISVKRNGSIEERLFVCDSLKRLIVHLL